MGIIYLLYTPFVLISLYYVFVYLIKKDLFTLCLELTAISITLFLLQTFFMQNLVLLYEILVTLSFVVLFFTVLMVLYEKKSTTQKGIIIDLLYTIYNQLILYFSTIGLFLLLYKLYKPLEYSFNTFDNNNISTPLIFTVFTFVLIHLMRFYLSKKRAYHTLYVYLLIGFILLQTLNVFSLQSVKHASLILKNNLQDYDLITLDNFTYDFEDDDITYYRIVDSELYDAQMYLVIEGHTSTKVYRKLLIYDIDKKEVIEKIDIDNFQFFIGKTDTLYYYTFSQIRSIDGFTYDITGKILHTETIDSVLYITLLREYYQEDVKVYEINDIEIENGEITIVQSTYEDEAFSTILKTHNGYIDINDSNGELHLSLPHSQVLYNDEQAALYISNDEIILYKDDVESRLFGENTTFVYEYPRNYNTYEMNKVNNHYYLTLDHYLYLFNTDFELIGIELIWEYDNFYTIKSSGAWSYQNVVLNGRKGISMLEYNDQPILFQFKAGDSNEIQLVTLSKPVLNWNYHYLLKSQTYLFILCALFPLYKKKEM